MAENSKIEWCHHTFNPWIAPRPNQLDAWERFAALVAAAEREACAKVCEDGVRDIGEAAIIGDDRRDASINVCTNLAKRIRARNQPPKGED